MATSRCQRPQAEIVLDATNPKERTKVDAHLIETRSWGGESGSPVFVHSQYIRTPPPEGLNDGSVYNVAGRLSKSDVTALEVDCRFLGVLHGHYEVARLPEHRRHDAGDRVADVNAGIAVVIPGREIWRLLMRHERLIQDREKKNGRRSWSGF